MSVQADLFTPASSRCAIGGDSCTPPIEGAVVFAVDLEVTAPGINPFWAAWKLTVWGLGAFDRFPGEAWPPPPPSTGLPSDMRGGRSRFMMWIRRVNKALAMRLYPGWRDYQGGGFYWFPWMGYDGDGEQRLAEYLRIAGEQRCAALMEIWAGRELELFRCSAALRGICPARDTQRRWRRRRG